jgi:hypothetical protein
MTSLRPFWCYYGGKWRLAPSYPAPRYRTIVEPFAGAAGYSLRYPARDVVLVERYHVVAEVWRFLTGASESEVLRIPCVEAVDDLPAWVCQGARWLVGFCLNSGTAAPRRVLSSGNRQVQAMGRKLAGWTPERRAMVASQLDAVSHWQIIEGDYTDAPDVEATHFIDPPYMGKAGDHYVHRASALDFAGIGRFAQARRGQVIVCESAGATWLPFGPHCNSKAGHGRAVSREVVWLS